jgi:hypothetical protein
MLAFCEDRAGRNLSRAGARARSANASRRRRDELRDVFGRKEASKS